MDYKSAGVDLEAAEQSTQKIIELARRTHGKNVLGDPGWFGGFFQFPAHAYREPVLVSSIDGVGTKVKLACQLGHYRGIGVDIVNHCLNDIMVGGAEPLFFLDYLAMGKIDNQVVVELLEGMSEACRAADCALIGGETAEMPDLYQPGEFDLAGTIIGVVEKAAIIDGSNIAAGDLAIGVASEGLHTNGYSLARTIVSTNRDFSVSTYVEELGETVGAALLRPHRSYRTVIRELRGLEGVRGFSHITGGGILGNTNRLLRDNLQLEMDWNAWEWPPLFELLQRFGRVADEEMRAVFNLGIGLVVIVAPAAADSVRERLRTLGERHWLIGGIRGD